MVEKEMRRTRANPLATSSPTRDENADIRRLEDKVQRLEEVVLQLSLDLQAIKPLTGTAATNSQVAVVPQGVPDVVQKAVPAAAPSAVSPVAAPEPALGSTSQLSTAPNMSVTYEKAFELLGGEAELMKYKKVSCKKQAEVNSPEVVAELKHLFPRDYTKRLGFSMLLVNQPYVRDLDTLYIKSSEVHAPFAATLKTLADKYGAEAMVPPLKARLRAEMKAHHKYKDVNGVAWHRLTDIVRGTLAFGDLKSLYAGVDDIITYFNGNVKEYNDRYLEPLEGGYRDIQMVVQFQGVMCELQLNTRLMLNAKKTTGHRDFEVVRELQAAVKEGNLPRVANAMRFGLEHQGSTAGENKHMLANLLQSDAARTLPHTAARFGHAEILDEFIMHGADLSVQDRKGNTPLHHAIFNGHERSVWALVNSGKLDIAAALSVKNERGITPLVSGFLMLWRRPPESSVRAVATLAQVAGVERVRAARTVADLQVRQQLHPSRILVDYAADGNVLKMLEELRDYADPDSQRDGKSALAAAADNRHTEAFLTLLGFRASLDRPEGQKPWLQEAVDMNNRDMAAALLNTETVSCTGVNGMVLNALDLDEASSLDCWCMWSGIAAVGTTLYCAPSEASAVLKIDTKMDKTELIDCHLGILDGSSKWSGIAAVGTKLYCAPLNASSILVIDTATEPNEVSHIPCVEGRWKWRGIAAVGLKLYCAPSDASSVLVIDTATDPATTYTVPCGVEGKLSNGGKWWGIAAVGTKLYCAPRNAAQVLVIDAETDETSLIECGVEGRGKWRGIAALGTKLYCAPSDATTVLVIDTETDPPTTSTIMCYLKRTQGRYSKWSGIAAVGTKLYCAPHNASLMLVVDPEAEQTSTIGYRTQEDNLWTFLATLGTMLCCNPQQALSMIIGSVHGGKSTKPRGRSPTNSPGRSSTHSPTQKLFDLRVLESGRSLIDVEDDDRSLMSDGMSITATFQAELGLGKWQGIAAIGSKIYCAPHSISMVLSGQDRLSAWGLSEATARPETSRDTPRNSSWN